MIPEPTSLFFSLSSSSIQPLSLHNSTGRRAQSSSLLILHSQMQHPECSPHRHLRACLLPMPSQSPCAVPTVPVLYSESPCHIQSPHTIPKVLVLYPTFPSPRSPCCNLCPRATPKALMLSPRSPCCTPCPHCLGPHTIHSVTAPSPRTLCCPQCLCAIHSPHAIPSVPVLSPRSPYHTPRPHAVVSLCHPQHLHPQCPHIISSVPTAVPSVPTPRSARHIPCPCAIPYISISQEHTGRGCRRCPWRCPPSSSGTAALCPEPSPTSRCVGGSQLPTSVLLSPGTQLLLSKSITSRGVTAFPAGTAAALRPGAGPTSTEWKTPIDIHQSKIRKGFIKPALPRG